ncbi:DNA-binding transcriptional regulator, LysR family [Sporobacter termitidis DSM 10068]|uniref:DNA-binding transcriptional regulator, LysR family n=1 Tax=Sporobacter termitidis DSM 10068 TaxID=1123282 RepID=A0A1M5XHA5_9FIRM|nr:LysR family transcriptional regulator [Sporobacter termitidis]SHH99217.1 DNA-binding transcriptional regulator, LysR family [Sporobacter termitidis DSM 10068]
MTVLQMKCFVNLATTKKLTDTANSFNLNTSTLSKSIDHMEDELSAKLFHKKQNKLELTNEGRIVYPSLQYIVKEYDELLLYMDRFTSTRRTAVNAAMIFHQPRMIELLLGFSKQNDDIDMTITEASATDIQAMLDTSSVDVAVIYEELLEKKYPYTFPIRRDKLVAVVGRDHPLAKRARISVSELKEETFFLFKGDGLMYRFLVHTCISGGFVPREAHSNLRINTIMECVKANEGVSLIIENTLNCLDRKNVVVLPLVENPEVTLSMFFPVVYLTETHEKLMASLNGECQ